MGQSLFARLIDTWKKIGMGIGDGMARVGLLIVFVLTVIPIHYIWVLLKKDPMKRKFQTQMKSYLEKSDPLREDHWERMF